MLDFTPNNPYSLLLRSPVLARAGRFGAGVERLAALAGVGAVVSDGLMVSDGPSSAWHETPAGVLWPAGGRSVRRAQRDLARWARLTTPILIAICPATPSDVAELLAALDGNEWAGLLLDLTAAATSEAALELAAAARRGWRRPLLAELAVDGQPLAELVAALGGLVDGWLLGRGPQAAVATGGGLVHGRIAGPAAQPALLTAAATVAGASPLPLAVSASSVAHGRAVAALAGERPLAHLLDVGLWRDPGLAAALAQLSR